MENQKMPEYETIRAAVAGEKWAVEKVVEQFNRLIQKVDELKRDGIIKDDVIIQSGFSTYEPKYCQWSKLIPYQQMVKNVADARIVITHGGARDIIGSTKKTYDN